MHAWSRNNWPVKRTNDIVRLAGVGVSKSVSLMLLRSYIIPFQDQLFEFGAETNEAWDKAVNWPEVYFTVNIRVTRRNLQMYMRLPGYRTLWQKRRSMLPTRCLYCGVLRLYNRREVIKHRLCAFSDAFIVKSFSYWMRGSRELVCAVITCQLRCPRSCLQRVKLRLR